MYKQLDEQELARYCSERDRLAEDELYRRYAAKVNMLCCRYTDNAEDAEDLMQDAIIKALDKISTFAYSGKGSLYAWIKRIAVNMAIDRIRRKRIRIVPLDTWAHDSIPEPTEQEMAVVPEDRLMEWISGLPDLRRAVFNMYCIDGYSHKEIAQMLKISEKGSAGVLAKARKQLKEEIRRYLKEQDK